MGFAAVVAVVGGGIGGAAVALALLQRGIRACTIVNTTHTLTRDVEDESDMSEDEPDTGDLFGGHWDSDYG
jgi:2-polyprenyl-6-methoxyphenol hydroxylase-like FAD-dependent oxidoreductase